MGISVVAAAGTSSPASQPYPPSWINRLIGAIHALPGPVPLAYSGLAALAVVIANAQNWLSGAAFEITPTQTFWGVMTVAFVAAIDYLNDVSGRAFDDFRSALSADRVDAARVRYQLTTMRPGVGLVILAVSVPLTIAYYAADPVASQVAGLSGIALVLRGAFESFFTALLLSLIVHAFMQLRIVSHLHAVADQIDPFQQGPIHAFARLTALTGSALTLVVSLGLASNARAVSSREFLVLYAPWLVGVVAVSIVIFVAPLLGMHNRLVAAKRQLQSESDERLKAMLAEVHRSVDAMELSRADALQKALGTLLQERDLLARLPTWPWSSTTIRGFGSALLLPLAVFLLQRVAASLLP